MTIKFSKEVSEFIEANGARSEDYFWFPQYYKKVGEGLFEIVDFKDLPNELSRIVEQLLPRNEDEEGDIKLFEKLVYADTRDIMFGVWLNENGWQPYDGMDRWINQKANNSVDSIVNLHAEYKKENPEP